MPEQHEYLTQEKYNEFSKELDFLKHSRRKEVAEDLEYAKSLGDLSENAEYHEARDVQANVEDRIAHLENVLKHATIIPADSKKHTKDVVGIGSVVSVKKEGGETKKYTIVGSEEADSTVGKISMKSPLGLALIGKKKGESFTVKTPGGVATHKVVDIQ